MELQDEGARLPGRDDLVDALDGALAAGGRPVVIVVSLRDLDDLRAGDPAAAETAVAVAGQRIAKLVRSSDVLACIGDGTFAVAGPAMAPESVHGLAERIRGAIAFPFETGDLTVSMVADVGWSASGGSGSGSGAVGVETAAELVAAAEADLAGRRGA